MSRTEWQDAYQAQKERLDSFPTQAHPAVRSLIRKFEDLLQYGLTHEFITPEGAARA